ncbi:MAG: DUF3306 domain-containing protein [Rubrivivax sp.]
MAHLPEDRNDSGFLSRWSQRKNQVRAGQPVTEVEPPVQVEPPVAPVVPAFAPTVPPVAAPDIDVHAADTNKPPAPTLDDVARLTRDADFSRFVATDVDGSVRNAALRKLFSDPHYNIMDGLDTYIGDYHTPDPLPAGMLRMMVQSEALGLFADEQVAQVPAAPPNASGASTTAQSLSESQVPDEDADLRLQPLDAAGPPGLEPGAGEDPASQH